MAEIKLLDNGMINKIAAGEVVERPASVVKELVENAVDAGATAITVEIKDGGIGLIRVTDNGRGIPREQARTAFLRHATSKIANMDDLENVMTMGFRGEALSSIAAVSEVELLTKTTGSEAGTRIEIRGGELIAEVEAGCADGTTFIMRNLFYNVPARRKFLKKPGTESGYVSDIVTKLALGNPHIAFKLVNNVSVLMQTNGGGLAAAALSIYGRDAVQKLLPVAFKRVGLELSGLIGKNELYRANRNYENFYINGRYVKSGLVESAVMEAYETRLPIGKFPVYILNLSASPNSVDVNVHPTKLEVRFGDEEEVYSFVREAVSQAFKGQNLIPRQQMVKTELPKPENLKQETPKEETPKTRFEGGAMPFLPDTAVKEAAAAYSAENALPPVTYIQMTQSGFKELGKREIPAEPERTENKREPEAFFKNYRIIGQVFNTYWLIEQDKSLYAVDQHAAHERVLFEEVTGRLKDGKIASQKLLVPMAVNLSAGERRIIEDNAKLFAEFGFEIEALGEVACAIRAVPYIFNKPEGSGFFTEILDRLAAVDTSVGNVYDTKLNEIATISCKAAVKANDRLSYMEAKSLIDKIVRLENPFTCPHGRPTIVEITKYELEKMFKRV